jgi:hypothetical protein
LTGVVWFGEGKVDRPHGAAVVRPSASAAGDSLPSMIRQPPAPRS